MLLMWITSILHYLIVKAIAYIEISTVYLSLIFSNARFSYLQSSIPRLRNDHGDLKPQH